MVVHDVEVGSIDGDAPGVRALEREERGGLAAESGDTATASAATSAPRLSRRNPRPPPASNASSTAPTEPPIHTLRAVENAIAGTSQKLATIPKTRPRRA